MSAHVPALPLALDPLIAEAKERARRRRLAALALLVVAGAGIALALALRSPGLPPARAVSAAGVRVHVPQGWYVSRLSLNSVAWPIQRFVVSSFPERFDASKTTASYLPPQSGVLAQVVEEYPPVPGEYWPARRAHVRLGQLGKMKLFGGNRWTELLFRL